MALGNLAGNLGYFLF